MSCLPESWSKCEYKVSSIFRCSQVFHGSFFETSWNIICKQGAPKDELSLNLAKMRVFSAAKFLPMFLFTSETLRCKTDLVPVLGPKPGPAAEFRNWDCVSRFQCVCVCCFLSFSVFLCLSQSFSVFLCLCFAGRMR